jgi:hypothetical protein
LETKQGGETRAIRVGRERKKTEMTAKRSIKIFLYPEHPISLTNNLIAYLYRRQHVDNWESIIIGGMDVKIFSVTINKIYLQWRGF